MPQREGAVLPLVAVALRHLVRPGLRVDEPVRNFIARRGFRKTRHGDDLLDADLAGETYGRLHLLAMPLAHFAGIERIGRAVERGDLQPARLDLLQLLPEQALVGEQFVGAEMRAPDQPPPVISTPSTPSATHLSSMSVKERFPITSVQMDSFMS